MKWEDEVQLMRRKRHGRKTCHTCHVDKVTAPWCTMRVNISLGRHFAGSQKAAKTWIPP